MLSWSHIINSEKLHFYIFHAEETCLLLFQVIIVCLIIIKIWLTISFKVKHFLTLVLCNIFELLLILYFEIKNNNYNCSFTYNNNIT